MPATLLIVDDERHTREGLQAALEDEYDVYLAGDADEAFRLLEAERFDLVLTDLRMAGKNGMRVVERSLQAPGPPVVIMMTAYGSVETAVEAMKRGAYDFLTKPLNLEKLELLLRRALRERRLESENRELHTRLDERFGFDGIIGQSDALKVALEQVRRVAPSRATVLLTGDTGTGKELFAQALHQHSERARKPFIAVHSAALPATLLESELFGHEKGAFTGAAERRAGRFEAADGGTLFLDEIGEIDASTQVKLLRFLESRTFERLGSVKPVTVDVRLVAATNRDLAAMVREGTFREDLYYRLNVVHIALPPLRARHEDIPALLQHFIVKAAEDNGVAPVKLDPATVTLLQHYRWPGNIRELRNFAENAVVMHRGRTLSPYDLDAKFRAGEEGEAGASTLPTAAAAASAQAPAGAPPLSVEEHEKGLLRQALLRAGGNRTEAARLLGISRRTLHRKLARWPELDR